MNQKVKQEPMETATLGGGCFWCLEAVFRQLQGVELVVSGFMGGHLLNPSYKEVCGGDTGHAEVIQVIFNPEKIRFSDLLEVFFASHDPTTLNRQGNDVGTQYRSVIFFHSPAQRDAALAFISRMENAAYVVTEVALATTFYPAEAYHQDYFARNNLQPYCQLVVAPKVMKTRKLFPDKVSAG